MTHDTPPATVGCARDRRWAGARLVATIACLTIPCESARAQQDRTNPPSANVISDSLARYVPRQDLALYLEFQGLDLHAADWHRTAAYRLLSETRAGTLFEDLAIQAIEVYDETAPTASRVKGVDAVETVKRVARQGFVFAIFGNPRTRWNYVIVLRNGDRPEVKTTLRLLATRWAGEAEEKSAATAFEKGGRKLERLRSGQVYWAEKSDLVITDAAETDEILDVLDGRRPVPSITLYEPSCSRQKSTSILSLPAFLTQAFLDNFRKNCLSSASVV